MSRIEGFGDWYDRRSGGFDYDPVPHPGRLIVLTGATAAGKTEVRDRLLQRFPDMRKVLTTTTRPPRPGEVDGVDLRFVTYEDFFAMDRDREFVESNIYAKNFYGTQKRDLQPLREGKNLVWVMPIQGCALLEEKLKSVYREQDAIGILNNTTRILIGTERLFVNKDRYLKRDSGDRDELKKRIKEDWNAFKRYRDYFDKIVVNRNDALDQTVDEVSLISGLAA